MGKQKRARQKYHLACVKAKKTLDEKPNDQKLNIESSQSNIPEWKILPKDDLFKNLNINIDDLIIKTNDIKNNDDDCVSVRSISKSIKSVTGGEQMKKKDKLQLRHNIFIKKIDAIYHEIRKRKKKGNDTIKEVSKTEFLLNKEPVEIKRERQKSNKVRSIKKAKDRRKDTLDNVALFKKLMNDPVIAKSPINAIQKAIHKKILSSKI